MIGQLLICSSYEGGITSEEKYQKYVRCHDAHYGDGCELFRLRP